MTNTFKRNLNWKAIAITAMFVIVVLVAALFVFVDNSNTNVDNVESSSPASETNENHSNNETISTIDDLMADFNGTDEEVKKICSLELQALDIEYVSIDQPLEGPFIYETRVGTYELNGILRTPSISPDMPQPKSTEMLCTIFPGDEYPVEITFGKDW